MNAVLLSRRGPVTFSRGDDGTRIVKRGPGGLVTALSGLSAELGDSVWVCLAAEAEDVLVAREFGGMPIRLGLGFQPRILEPHQADPRTLRVRLVEVPPEVHRPFYEVVVNPLLWFVQHRLYGLAEAPSLGRAERAAFNEGYVKANWLAAEVVVEEVKRNPGRPVVFIHDYHFYLVGGLVRSACPDAVISHFVHIPWPCPESWAVLPTDMYDQILTGLLGCDVVGFHTPADANAFLRCVQDRLGLSVNITGRTISVDGREVHVRVYPISIDIAALEEIAQGREAQDDLYRLEHHLQACALILRVDRADPSKNIVRGFDAYSLMLSEHPELVGKVMFVAFVEPTRMAVPEYRAYLEKIREAADRVNAEHGTGSWQPVELRVSANFSAIAAAYRRCDVLVVNAIADGMNLVVKEAVAVNERPMAMTLSRFAGVHHELGQFALPLDPFDIAQQADSLYAALQMPVLERRSLLNRAKASVRSNDVHRWFRLQLQDLTHMLRHQQDGSPPGSTQQLCEDEDDYVLALGG